MTDALTIQEVCRKISSFIPSAAWDSTVSIVGVPGGREELHQFGTGTLFRIADQSFLVTAGHVIKDASKYDIGLCITTPRSSFVQIHAGWGT